MPFKIYVFAKPHNHLRGEIEQEQVIFADDTFLFIQKTKPGGEQ